MKTLPKPVLGVVVVELAVVVPLMLLLSTHPFTH